MSAAAEYAASPRYEIAVCSAANTNYDGTGTIVELFTAGPNGSRVDQVGWSALGTTTAGLLKFFVRESSSDTWRFFFATRVTAVTASATVEPWGGGATNLNWVLTAGAQIGFAPSKAESFMAHVSLAGDF